MNWITKIINAILEALLKPTPPKPPTPTPPTPPTPPPNPADFVGVLLDLHNKERAAVGVKALTWNPVLDSAAHKHSDWMAKNQTLDHSENGVTFGTRIHQAGYKYSYAGENIAVGQRTPADVMKSWMNSPGHRNNILNDHFKEAGFGMATDKNGRKYWTADFGARKISMFTIGHASLPGGIEE